MLLVLYLLQHVSRPVHQPVLLLDGEPLLVIDADDELADETKVGKIITSEAMAAGPQVQKPEDRNVIIFIKQSAAPLV